MRSFLLRLLILGAHTAVAALIACCGAMISMLLSFVLFGNIDWFIVRLVALGVFAFYMIQFKSIDY